MNPINGSDYINASLIQKVNREASTTSIASEYLSFSNITLILSQDPTADTEEHYLQMIHEQKVNVVVQVGGENDPSNCLKLLISKNFISKNLIEHVNLGEHLVREKMEVRVKGKAAHPFTVYSFTAWPIDDQFGPEDSKNFLTAFHLIQNEIKCQFSTLTLMSQDRKGGISGAASFIIMYKLLEELDIGMRVIELKLQEERKEVGTLNIFKTVNGFRSERAYMIRSFHEYKFLFETLAFYAKNKSCFDNMLPNHSFGIANPRNFTKRANILPRRINQESVYLENEDESIFDRIGRNSLGRSRRKRIKLSKTIKRSNIM